MFCSGRSEVRETGGLMGMVGILGSGLCFGRFRDCRVGIAGAGFGGVRVGIILGVCCRCVSLVVLI